MKKSFVYCVAAIAAVFFISGCSTVPKKFREEVSGIKSRVDNLESKVENVEAKQQETARVTSEQGQAIEEIKVAKETHEAKTNISIKPREFKSRGRIKEIQACLKNAGFYNGRIDGVKGKGTRKAIREFQKANGLKVDGIVGSKTWELLSKYSGSGAQGTAAGGAEEGATTK